MRLIKQADSSWKPLFTVIWEVEYLAEVGNHWIPFALPQTEIIVGEIHALRHDIRLNPEATLSTRQVVTLVPRSTEEERGE